MSRKSQSQISPETFLLDDNEKIWIVGSFIGADGCADNYEAAEYKGMPPTDYPAVIKIKPHGDESFSSEIKFYEQHANPAEIAKWITYQNIQHDDLGIPRYLGSAENIKVANTNFDFLVLEQYGSDLETILVTHKNLFPKPTVLKLAYHTVRVLEYFHNRGFVHGDIQASNLRLGRHDKSRVYLLQQVETVDASHRNSIIFWSEDRHSGAKTKRGDFESLLYNLIDWSGGLLPWRNAPPDEVKGMKIKVFQDPERFLQDAFPNCECENPSECLAARKCVATGNPVAPYQCLQGIAEFMKQVAAMKENDKPNYVDIEEALRKRLLNMYQVPTSELEFSVPTIISDEDHEEKFSRGRGKGANSYVRGLGITAGRLATIIAENCTSFDEVDVFDIKPGGVVDVIFKMKRTNRECAVKLDNIRKTWEKNAYGLRTMVIEQWRLKGLKPGDYEVWKKEKDRQQAALDGNAGKKQATTKAKKKIAQMTGQKLLDDIPYTDEPIVPQGLDVDANNDGGLPHSRTQRSQQIGPADKPTQRVPSRHRDRSSSSSSTLSDVRRTLQETHSSFVSDSNGFQTPFFSASSSGFSSRRSSCRGDVHSVDSSPLAADQFLGKVPHQSPRKVVAEAAENKHVTGRRSCVPVNWQEWPDTYKWLTVWLKMKDKDLKAFDSIPSESQMIVDQVEQVRVLLDEFDKSEDRLNHLVEALAKLPSDSADAEKLRQIEQRWRDGLALLEERGKQLGDTSLSQLRHVLQDVSDSLTQPPIDKEQLLPIEKEGLLRELGNLSGQLQSQQAQLVNTETVVRQLTEVLIDVNLQEEFQTLIKLHDDLKQKVQAEKAEIERSIRDRRQFDDLRQEILVWLVKENEGISEKPPVSTDHKTLLKQHENYKSIFQRIMDREAEVIALLAKGDILSRPKNLENANIQQRTLDAVRSQWNLLKRQSVEIDNKLQSCVEHCNEYYEAQSLFLDWLGEAERKPIMLNDSQKQLEELTVFSNEVREKSDECERIINLGDTFVAACDNDENDKVKNELIAIKGRWNKLTSDLRDRMQSLKDLDKCLVVFKDRLHKLAQCVEELASHDVLAGESENPKLIDHIKELQVKWVSLQQSLDIIRQQANDLVAKAREQGIDAEHLLEDVDHVADQVANLEAKLVNRCKEIVEQGFTNFERQPGEVKQEKIDVKVELEQDDESRANINRPPVEVIDLSSDDESLDMLFRQINEIVQTDDGGMMGAFFNNKQSSNATELQQKSKDKSLAEKENDSSGKGEDAENTQSKKAKPSREKRKKFPSAASNLKDSGSDYNGKKRKGKTSGKRKKVSDSDWSPARASGSKDCDSDWSPSRVSGRKRPRRKTRPLPAQDDDSDFNGSDLNESFYC